MTLISAHNLTKTYRLGRVDVPVLRGVDVNVERGEWLAVLGASGSGKSTLLHLLGGLDRPDKGSGSTIEFEGRSLADMSARELDRHRNTRVGFVFQFYHLLPELTVLENTALGSMIRYGRIGYRMKAGEVRKRANEILTEFGLEHRLRHRPAELSGGERQRTALARALMNAPDLLLADEPTGNLDRKTGDRILESIERFHKEHGQTIIMVTHDPLIAERADRCIRLVDGLAVDGADVDAEDHVALSS